MGHLRAVPRLAAVLVATMIAGLTVVLGLPFAAGRAGRLRWRARVTRGWARWLARLAGIRIEVQGRAPESPFLLVTNHLGYIDVVVLGTQVPASFVSRADMGEWPLVGLFARAGATIFVERRRTRRLHGVVGEIREMLDSGVGVIVFPEGTSSPGDEVLPFRPPLLEAAVGADLPVSFAALAYDTGLPGSPARDRVCWWGDMTFPGHVYRLFQLPGFRATIRFGDRTVRTTDRKALAAELRDAVTRELVAIGKGRP